MIRRSSHSGFLFLFIEVSFLLSGCPGIPQKRLRFTGLDSTKRRDFSSFRGDWSHVFFIYVIT